CNFNIEHLQRLLDECEVAPTVNQVECHPYLQQKELKHFCEKHNIYVESWSPLNQGGAVLQDDVVKQIAEQHGKTPAQVIIRWHLQSSSSVIPKSVAPSRVEENVGVLDFELSEDDVGKVEMIDRNERNGMELR